MNRTLERAAAAGHRSERNGLEAIIQSFRQRGDVARPLTTATSRASRTIVSRVNTESGPAIRNRERAILQQNDDPALARVRLERILQGNELSDINYLAQGLSSARSVCRIVLRRQGRLLGYGTGFLVAPGVLMTNHHVLSTVEDVVESVAQFRYERTIQGAEATPIEFALATSPAPVFDRRLDFALIAIGGPTSLTGTHTSTVARADGTMLEDFGWLRLNPQPGKGFIGEYLTIIQHPNGERKQVCVRENRLLKYDANGPFVWYQSDTVGGSSGSPVFNNSWEVVALHHSGVPRTGKVNGRTVWLTKDGKPWSDGMGEDQIDWIANEGIRISQIFEFLRTNLASHPLAQRVTGAMPAPWMESVATAGDGSTGRPYQVYHDGNGTTRILIPVEIGVRIPIAQTPVVPVPAPMFPGRAGADDQTSGTFGPTEAVQIDTGNYPRRNGYNPKFLGEGTLSVPLPRLQADIKPQMLIIKGTSGELKYWNYSVVLHKARGLAFFSAANIDPALGKGNRAGDGWIRDSRVDAINSDAQVGNEFYKKQKTFEATEDRSKNPFDQGHLTRREDLQWGRTETIAKRNGDDSFHYPNCAPQHFEFNQARKVNGIWNRLEQMTTQIAGDGATFCVFNGSIFDAPLCVEGDDGRLHLNLRGDPKTDPTFGGIRIPRQFYKVIVWPEESKLRVAAFVVTQEDLLAKVNRLRRSESTREAALLEAGLSEDEVRLYQVTLEDLEHATRLDFGKLTGLPIIRPDESAVAPVFNVPIEDEHDIRL